MSDKRKIIITIIVLILFLGLSVFFWLITKHWYYGLIPAIVVAVIEISAKEYKRKGKIVPSDDTLAQNGTEPQLITSISVLLLKDFITCCADNNLSVLGVGTPEQLQTAFETILSQYYNVRRDDHVKKYIELLREVKAIELHQALINSIATIMRERYSFSGAEALRKHYPLFKFEKETFVNDLAAIGNLEIKSGVRLERLKKQLDALQKAQESDKKHTPEQIRIGFISRIADINKVEQIGYDMMNKTVMEFAVYENRLIEHIENLQKQAKAQR